MRAIPVSSIRFRQLFLLGAAFLIAVISCGREVTGPAGTSARFARGVSFNARFPEALQQASGGAASIVPFTKVRIVLHHSNGSIALDTVIVFPSGSDQFTLGLTVSLLASAPADGEPMILNLAYVNAAGDTVFRGGPVSVLAVPSAAGQPAPVQVPVTYSGPGANAKSVKISPKTLSVAAGDNFSFSGSAADGNGTTIPNTPIVWTTLDPALATVTSAAAGSGVAKIGRGTARIVAQLLTASGTDTATLTVLPSASSIVAVSGGGQSGSGGAALAQPVVVVVTATDLLPIAGVSVAFAAANGGTVGSPTTTTDANGRAQTTWTLGATVGPQTLTASVAGLTGSPVTFGAISTSGQATKLVVSTQPASGIIGAALPAVVLTAQDAGGNVAKGFTGSVTLSLNANPGGGKLGGSTTVNAIAGAASFTTLTIDKAGLGYTLTGSASGLTSATTSAFDVTAPPAALLGLVSGGGQTAPAFSTLPAPIVVQVVDAAGNDMKDAGRTVTFSSTSGGGSVTPASAITDAQGRASVTWTLGAATGPQTMTASSTGLTSIVIRATATASIGQSFTWLGAVDTSWTNPANWSPTGVPGANDDVYISYAQSRPSISSPTSIRSLALGVCESVQLTSTLTISGSVADSANSCIRAPQATRMNTVGVTNGVGTVILTGDGTVMGDFRGELLITGGTHTLSGYTTSSGSIVVSGTSRLVLNGKTLYAYGTFATSGGGTLQMTDANDYLHVDGSTSFGGGSETGLLTAGVLELAGDFAQVGSATAFAPGGTHATRLNAGAAQNLSFANPATSFFQDLEVYYTTTIVFSTNVTVKGTFSDAGTSITLSSATGTLLTVSGLNFYAGGSGHFTNVRLKYTDGVAGAPTLDNSSFSGFGSGATVFEFNRTSGGPYNFTNLSFSGALNASGRYVTNTGTVPLTLTTPTPTSTAAPTSCGCTTWFTPGTGGITWP